MQKLIRLIVCATALFATIQLRAEDKSTIKWKLDSDEFTNWTEPSAWNRDRAPDGDLVGLLSQQYQRTNVRIDTQVAPIRNLLLGNVANATSVLEVATGGLLVITNGTLVMVGHGTYSAVKNVSTELRITGGVVSNAANSLCVTSIGHEGDSTYARTVFSMSAGSAYFSFVEYNNNWWCSRTAGFSGLFEITGGEFNLNGNFILPPSMTCRVAGGKMMFNKSGAIASFNGPYEQSGGVVDVPSDGHFYFRAYDGAKISGGSFTNNRYMEIYGGDMEFSGTANVKTATLESSYPVGKSGIIRISGGTVNTSGLYFYNQNSSTYTGACDFVMSGGKYTSSGGIAFDCDLIRPPRLLFTGGEYAQSGGISTKGTSATFSNGATFCIRGNKGTVQMGALQTVPIQGGSTHDLNSTEARIHYVQEIDQGEVSPLYINSATYNSGSQNLRGVYSLHPYGGLQLAPHETYIVVTSKHSLVGLNGWGKDIDQYFRMPDERLWHGGFFSDGNHNPVAYLVTLTNTAEVASGFTSAEGVPLGWFKVPAERRARRYLRVHLGLVPKGTNTLEGLVAGINGAGYSAKVESSDDYNVAVDLPVDRVGIGNADRRVIFDFTTEESPNEAKLGHVVTNAVVTAFGYEPSKDGLMILVR